jgi:hypothetical protein
MKLEVGKIYRVNDYAVSDDARFAEENRAVTKQHGWIWVCEQPWDKETSVYECRSLATGYIERFTKEELEAADG